MMPMVAVRDGSNGKINALAIVWRQHEVERPVSPAVNRTDALAGDISVA